MMILLGEAYLGSSHVVSYPRARGQKSSDRVHVINYHHVIHALKRKPGALANSIYRNSLFPRTEYVLVWKALQASLSRRYACRRMVDILFLAHEENAEAALASLMADDLQQGRLSDALDLKALLIPRDHSLPKDVAVNYLHCRALTRCWRTLDDQLCNRYVQIARYADSIAITQLPKALAGDRRASRQRGLACGAFFGSVAKFDVWFVYWPDHGICFCKELQAGNPSCALISKARIIPKP